MSSGLLFQGLASPPLRAKPEETPLLARELAVDSHFQTRSINRSPEAALRGNNIPSPLAGEGQGEGEGEGIIWPSFLASRRFAPGYPDAMLSLYARG